MEKKREGDREFYWGWERGAAKIALIPACKRGGWTAVCMGGMDIDLPGPRRTLCMMANKAISEA
jgi:hypothetical protein